jgi:DNA ligase D-like protein (predicted polymerase)
MALKRFVDGAGGDFFFQKRAPEKRPPWIETVELAFPSGRTAEEVVLTDAASLAWVVNLGCLDLNPHPVRADDLDHPDELRVDLDPVPGVPWSDVRTVAQVTREALEAVGLVGWPKTSGSRGIHINVRIERRWTFPQVRRAALALARDVEARAPAIATSKWWKEERHGVFLDYNQNARDRTVASAYSVRATPDARVSMPLAWHEVPDVVAEDFTLATVPALYAVRGDLAEGMDEAAGSLEALLELSARHEAEGLGDAPWPPHYRKQAGEPPRVQPSRQRSGRASRAGGRRVSSKPLIEIARAARKDDALAGLERWKARHPDVAARLQPADVLVDAMRGRSTTWTRVRVNLEHVPEADRPPQEALDPDYDPWASYRQAGERWPSDR